MLPHLHRFVLAAQQVEDFRPFLQTVAGLGVDLMRPPKAEFCFGELIELTQHGAECPLRRGPIGGKGHRLPVTRDCLGKLSLRCERLAKIIVGRGHSRLETNRLPIIPDRLLHSAEVAEGVAEVVVGFGIAGPPREGAPKLPLCLVKLALLLERVAEIVVGFHMIGIEPYGSPVMRLCLAHATESVESGAEIAVEIRDAIIAREGLADQVDRGLVVPRFMGDDAEEMQAIGVVRISRKDLPVNALGLLEPASLMQAAPLLQGLVGVEDHAHLPR